jgi:hypothetical protein
VPPLRLVLNRLSAIEKATTLATRALRALQSFSSTFKVKVGEVELGVKDPAAMSGNLETDLPELLLIVAQAAQAASAPVAILVDEVQYLSNEDLSALIVSAHKIGQRQLPLVLFGAGLPQLAALAGDAKSYAERLFHYPCIGPLDQDAAERAIREPIRSEGADIRPARCARSSATRRAIPTFSRSGARTRGTSHPGRPSWRPTSCAPPSPS